MKVIPADGGDGATVFQAEIVHGSLIPAGPWDHPVPPTPSSDPAAIGQSGTGWVQWSYTFPHSGTYRLEVSSTNAVDRAGPSALGIQLPTPNPIHKGQSIDLTTPDTAYGDAPFDLNATAVGSATGEPTGNPVMFSAATTDVCTVNPAGPVDIRGAGDCQVSASAKGDDIYAPASVTHTIHVAKAPLSIDADGQSKQYGGPDPSFTYGLSGFVNHDTEDSAGISGNPDCSIVPGTASGVGVQPGAVACAPGTLSSANYSFQTGSPGTLTITKAPLSVNAYDATTQYGQSAPTLEYAYGLSGLVGGDTEESLSPSGEAECFIAPGTGTDPGVYPGAIICVPGTLDTPNYSFQTGSPGTLTIAKADQTITFIDLSDKAYGDPDFSPATTSSQLAVTYSVEGDCTVDPGSGMVHLEAPASWPGQCTITASQSGDDDYNAATPVTHTIAVKAPVQPPSITITTPTDSATYYQYQQVTADYACEVAAGLDVASCAGDVGRGAPIDTVAPGSHSFTVQATDTSGGTAQMSVAYTVIAVGSLPGGGAFVIGDRNASVGTRVTYWGSQWWKLNSLSGGPAPSAFKGYADLTSGTPPSCGEAWMTRPGSSSKPPKAVPPYMAVIASGAIGQSGGTISGDTRAVVVVKTDPGYDANPGHAGTGAVVARLCGNKLNQTISFNAPVTKTVSDPDFAPGARASSGLPVSYRSSTPSVCQIVSDKVDLIGVGDCTVTASQAGNDAFNAAPDVARTIKVNPIAPVNCGCRKQRNRCESLLVSPNPVAGSSVGPGQTMTIAYTDDNRIGTGTLGPTAQLSNGQLLPVTVTPTSRQPFNYVTSYRRDLSARHQYLLTFSLPANLAQGAYSILITAYEDHGDVDQWSSPITVR